MRTQVRQADKVLLIFTETYQRKFEGDEEAGKGLGTTFEGVIVPSGSTRAAGATRVSARGLPGGKTSALFLWSCGASTGTASTPGITTTTCFGRCMRHRGSLRRRWVRSRPFHLNRPLNCFTAAYAKTLPPHLNSPAAKKKKLRPKAGRTRGWERLKNASAKRKSGWRPSSPARRPNAGKLKQRSRLRYRMPWSAYSTRLSTPKTCSAVTPF